MLASSTGMPHRCYSHACRDDNDRACSDSAPPWPVRWPVERHPHAWATLDVVSSDARADEQAGQGESDNNLDRRISAAVAAVPRKQFLPRRQRRHAAEDRPLQIGKEQTNSQPTTVHNMLALLDPQPGHRVLDVGSGSGWTCGLLGHLVGSTGKVYGVELVPELVAMSANHLNASAQPWVSVRQAEKGVLGIPSEAPFDRILVSAMAAELPDALVDQVGRKGRMVIPVAGRLSVVDRHADGAVEVRRIGHYAFVPLK